jgi:hypothetical protein
MQPSHSAWLHRDAIVPLLQIAADDKTAYTFTHAAVEVAQVQLAILLLCRFLIVRK